MKQLPHRPTTERLVAEAWLRCFDTGDAVRPARGQRAPGATFVEKKQVTYEGYENAIFWRSSSNSPHRTPCIGGSSMLHKVLVVCALLPKCVISTAPANGRRAIEHAKH